MPFMQVNLAQKLTSEEKQGLASCLGQAVTHIPGKTENALMVNIADNQNLFFRGQPQEKAAYIEIRIYGDCEKEVKSKISAQVTEYLNKELAVPEGNIYMNYVDSWDWGIGGRQI